jgi:hypothetical protein
MIDGGKLFQLLSIARVGASEPAPMKTWDCHISLFGALTRQFVRITSDIPPVL